MDEGRFVAGTVVGGRYRIGGLLGRGGMGEVYRATDLTLGQAVALKFLPEKTARDERALARFYNEVRIARQVTHSNVCRVYDVGQPRDCTTSRWSLWTARTWARYSGASEGFPRTRGWRPRASYAPAWERHTKKEQFAAGGDSYGGLPSSAHLEGQHVAETGHLPRRNAASRI